jgi:TM2 domain-containing membrane protein YozV
VKQLILLLFTTLLIISSSSVKAGNYQIDDKSLDQIFASAQTVNLSDLSDNLMPLAADANSTALTGAKDPLVAILLDLFAGTLGIHRFYLGTEPLTGIAYLLTCGGIFGIVPLVDLVVLVINYDDISPYVDNPKFFMW